MRRMPDFNELSLCYEAKNIQNLGDELCNNLKCGDVVAKITGNQKHCYQVSYKGVGEGEGMCLTYCAAGLIETVSYDFIDGHWVYNSTDICDLSDHIQA